MNLPNGKQISAETVAENVWVRLLARAGMALLALTVPVIGYIWTNALGNIDKAVGATLHQVQQLADAERRNSDAILEIRGDLRVGNQKDAEQDRALERHERILTRTRTPWRPE